MHLLLTEIDWDTDGMRPVEDCNLPLSVLAINAPAHEMNADELTEYLGDLLHEVYGFHHYGFTPAPISLDGVRCEDINAGERRMMSFRQATQWSELANAVMDASSL